MLPKLYEITEDIAAIITEEEWTEDTERRLESLSMALEKKAENIIGLCTEWESFVAAAKAEEQRIAGRRKAVENRIGHLKGYLQRCMESADIMTMEAGTHSLRIQQNPPRVVVDSEETIPPRFFVIIPEQRQLDKKAIAEALKKEDIPGAHLEQGTSLRIR